MTINCLTNTVLLAHSAPSTSLNSSRSINILLRLTRLYLMHYGLFQQALLMRKKLETENVDSSGFFVPEKKGIRKGVVGGIIMIVIALVWFFVGLGTGRIFFYPPVLLIIGIVGVIKGITEGNLSGEKYKKSS